MLLNIVTHSINYGQLQKVDKLFSHLVEISVEEAAGEVRSTLHQLEETHKVVAVERSKCLHRKLHLRGVTDLVPELLHLPAEAEIEIEIYIYTVYDDQTGNYWRFVAPTYRILSSGDTDFLLDWTSVLHMIYCM